MKKTILVTGGNRGIGLEICRQLAGLGHRVIVCSRDLQKGLAAAYNMRGNIVVVQLDVTDEESIQALFNEVNSRFGKLDVLINNAGIGSAEWNRPMSSRIRDKLKRDFRGIWEIVKLVKPVLRWTGITGKRENASNVNLQQVRPIMETNFYGPWRMMQVFMPLLEKSDDPRIINMSSGLGELKSLKGEYPGYSISKSSLNALTIMFSNELGKKGIKVNAMCPGWVRTDMGGPDAPRSVSQGADTAVWLATEENIPAGKFFRDRKEINW
jgi:NAD(P)-dependent dehydrogenase (short-subunit alcohol dehydrogenase family)